MNYFPIFSIIFEFESIPARLADLEALLAKRYYRLHEHLDLTLLLMMIIVALPRSFEGIAEVARERPQRASGVWLIFRKHSSAVQAFLLR